MGKVKELLFNGATDEEINNMIDNAKDQWHNSYITFLEEQIEIKDKALKEIKLNLNKMKKVLNNNKKETS